MTGRHERDLPAPDAPAPVELMSRAEALHWCHRLSGQLARVMALLNIEGEMIMSTQDDINAAASQLADLKGQVVALKQTVSDDSSALRVAAMNIQDEIATLESQVQQGVTPDTSALKQALSDFNDEMGNLSSSVSDLSGSVTNVQDVLPAPSGDGSGASSGSGNSDSSDGSDSGSNDDQHG